MDNLVSAKPHLLNKLDKRLGLMECGIQLDLVDRFMDNVTFSICWDTWTLLFTS